MPCALFCLSTTIVAHAASCGLSDVKPNSISWIEPPRVYRRLHSLRGWGHGESEQIFSGSAGARGADGVRAHAEPRVAVGCDHLDRREDRVCGGNAAALGATGRA